MKTKLNVKICKQFEENNYFLAMSYTYHNCRFHHFVVADVRFVCIFSMCEKKRIFGGECRPNLNSIY